MRHRLPAHTATASSFDPSSSSMRSGSDRQTAGQAHRVHPRYATRWAHAIACGVAATPIRRRPTQEKLYVYTVSIFRSKHHD